MVSPQRIELHFNYIGEFKSAEPKQAEDDFAKLEKEKAYREHRRAISKKHREKKKLEETMKARGADGQKVINADTEKSVS